MKVKELQQKLAECDPEAIVLVAGFETTATLAVAEADAIISCTTEPCSEDSMSGNRVLSSCGNPSIWIGWSKDYRTESFMYAAS